MALSKTEVSQLYVSIFNRASEGAGNSYWQSRADLASAADAATEMLATSDAKAYFGSSLDTDQAFIEHIYQNTLNKTISDDPGGITYWVNQLQSKNRGEVVSDLIKAIETYSPTGVNYDPNDTATVNAYNQFANRVEVSNHMADTVQETPSDYATSTSFSAGLLVTSDSSTVTSAKSTIETVLGGNSSAVSLGIEYETFDLEGFSQYGIDGKHIYIVKTDLDGTQYVLEGGLYNNEDPVNITTRTGEITRGSFEDYENVDGLLEDGSYLKPENTISTYVSLNVDNSKIASVWDEMVNYAQSIENQKIEYIFSPGPNSNTVASAILENSGFIVEDILNINLPIDITSENAMQAVLSGQSDIYSVGFIGVQSSALDGLI